MLEESANQWLSDGYKVAVAQLIRTEGSAPLAVGSRMFVREDGLFTGSVSGGCAEALVLEAADRVLRSDVPEELEVASAGPFSVGLACGGKLLISVRVLDSPVEQVFRGTLIIIGAVAIAEALVPMAQAASFDVRIVDPRSAFARKERFSCPVQALWPQDALATLEPGVFGVVLTHDDKIDVPALSILLRSHAKYVGALGSRRTQAKRIAMLQDLGFEESELSGIRGPIGLDIGAETAEEIAVSILAELIQVRASCS